jgi:hypothetical protein
VKATEGAELPIVNWGSRELVRVRCRAEGYMTEGDTEARFGTIAYDSRLGGYKHFVFLYEPMPSRLWQFGTDVSSVFSRMDRERWFTVPTGAELEFGSNGMALYDLIFGVLTGLLVFALLVVVARLRRTSVELKASEASYSSYQPGYATAMSSR